MPKFWLFCSMSELISLPRIAWIHQPDMESQSLPTTLINCFLSIPCSNTRCTASNPYINHSSSVDNIKYSCLILFFILFSFATKVGSPQQREPITVSPYYLATLSTFPVRGNRSTRRKPTIFSRALIILFSHEDWGWVQIKMNLTGNRTRNLRGERQVVWPLHHRSPCGPLHNPDTFFT